MLYLQKNEDSNKDPNDYFTNIRTPNDIQQLLEDITVLEPYFELSEKRLKVALNIAKDVRSLKFVNTQLQVMKDRYSKFRTALESLQTTIDNHHDNIPLPFDELSTHSTQKIPFETLFDGFYSSIDKIRKEPFAKYLSECDNGAVLSSRIHSLLRKLVIFSPSNNITAKGYEDSIDWTEINKSKEYVVLNRRVYFLENIGKALRRKPLDPSNNSPIHLEDYLYLLAKLQAHRVTLPEKPSGLGDIPNDYLGLCQLIVSHNGPIEDYLYLFAKLQAHRVIIPAKPSMLGDIPDDYLELCQLIVGHNGPIEDYLYLLDKLQLPAKPSDLADIPNDYLELCQLIVDHGGSIEYHVAVLMAVLASELEADQQELLSLYTEHFNILGDDNTLVHLITILGVSLGCKLDAEVILGYQKMRDAALAKRQVVLENLADKRATQNSFPLQRKASVSSLNEVSEKPRSNTPSVQKENARKKQLDAIREARKQYYGSSPAESSAAFQSMPVINKGKGTVVGPTQKPTVRDVKARIRSLLGRYLTLLECYGESTEGVLNKLSTSSNLFQSADNFIANLEALDTAKLGILYKDYGFQKTVGADRNVIKQLKACALKFQEYQTLASEVPDSAVGKLLGNIKGKNSEERAILNLVDRFRERDSSNPDNPFEEELKRFKEALQQLEKANCAEENLMSEENSLSIVKQDGHEELPMLSANEKGVLKKPPSIDDTSETQHDDALTTFKKDAHCSLVQLSDDHPHTMELLQQHGNIKKIIESILLIKKSSLNKSSKALEYFSENIKLISSHPGLRCLYTRCSLESMLEDQSKVLEDLIALEASILDEQNSTRGDRKKLFDTRLNPSRKGFFKKLITTCDCDTPQALLFATKAMQMLLNDERRCSLILTHERDLIRSIKNRYKTIEEEALNALQEPLKSTVIGNSSKDVSLSVDKKTSDKVKEGHRVKQHSSHSSSQYHKPQNKYVQKGSSHRHLEKQHEGFGSKVASLLGFHSSQSSDARATHSSGSKGHNRHTSKEKKPSDEAGYERVYPRR